MAGQAVEVVRADVAIAGAGIVGLSVAWWLRRLGVERVVVLDGGLPGCGSTGKASGGVRRQFGSRIEIEMTLASLPFFERLLADPVFPGRFEALGYAFLAGPEQAPGLRAAWTLQRGMGLDVRWLDPPELREMFPYIAAEGLAGGTFCAEDGFINPWEVVEWLVRACRADGVSIRERTPVVGFEVSGGRLRSVRCEGLEVRVDVGVIAAGAWSAQVGEMAEVVIPVTPSPRVKFMTDPHPALPATMPLITDLATGAYVRSERGHAMVGVTPPQTPTGFDVSADAGLLAWMGEQAMVRFPSLATASIRNVVTGLYEVTPDGLPVAGATPGVAGLYAAAGFNGHGIMHGPAVAQAVAELIATGRAEALDLAPLRIDRGGGRRAEGVHLL